MLRVTLGAQGRGVSWGSVVKGVSDPGLRAESWPSQFISSLGPWGDRLGGKGPGDGRRGLGWALGQSQAWTLARSPAFSSSLPHPCPLQDDPQCSHGPALRQRWLLRGAGLDFIRAHVLHRESAAGSSSPGVGAGDKLPLPGPTSALSFIPGALFANSSPGPRQHGGPGPPATSPALPDSGSCSLSAPHDILADLPPGPVTPGPHWH